MSVYVDPLMNHGWVLNGKPTMSCHMFADSKGELVAFARRLRLKETWLQGENRNPPFLHFDLVPSMRALAVKAGASELSREEAVAKWRNLAAPFFPAAQKCHHDPEVVGCPFCISKHLNPAAPATEHSALEALYALYACFNDEGELAEQYQDQVSVALEAAEKALAGRGKPAPAAERKEDVR